MDNDRIRSEQIYRLLGPEFMRYAHKAVLLHLQCVRLQLLWIVRTPNVSS